MPLLLASDFPTRTQSPISQLLWYVLQAITQTAVMSDDARLRPRWDRIRDSENEQQSVCCDTTMFLSVSLACLHCTSLGTLGPKANAVRAAVWKRCKRARVETDLTGVFFFFVFGVKSHMIQDHGLFCINNPL